MSSYGIHQPSSKPSPSPVRGDDNLVDRRLKHEICQDTAEPHEATTVFFGEANDETRILEHLSKVFEGSSLRPLPLEQILKLLNLGFVQRVDLNNARFASLP
jgi:hypothetical protein